MQFGNPLHRPRLSTLLVAVIVGLLLVAIAAGAIVAVSLLERLADDQALARVAQAGASAQKAVAQAGGEAMSDAQLLSERPTLRRLLDSGDTAGLQAFLAQFQASSRNDGLAVLVNDRVFAYSGSPLVWDRLWAEQRDTPNSYIIRPSQQGDPLVVSAWAPVPNLPGTNIIVAKLLDDAFARQVSADIGLPVGVHELRQALAQGAYVALREQVATSGQLVTARRDDLAAYLAIYPVRDAAGTLAGFVETRLSTADIALSLRRLVESLMLITLVVAVLAAGISLVLARWLAQPVQVLTRAAARIGHGDLTTPVASVSGGELGTLAATLEEMRRRLLRLTADLQRQEAESSAIVASIVEGVFSVDRQRRIRYVNPQLASLLDIEAGQAIGRFCGDVLNPQGPDGGRPCDDHCPIVHSRFRAGARATEHLLLHTGETRTVVITSAPPSDNQQVQVMRDETEVEATRRLRDAVLANISHEFRTPLSAQLASIELLLDQLGDLSTQQIGDLVKSLQRGALRLTQLIDNLLESVRIEAGEYTIRRRPVALDEVIEEALELTRPLLEQRQQEAIVQLPYPLPALAGDARRLTQVFVNLVANANKFSPPGTHIRIGGAVEADTVTLWVEDQGPGLPDPAVHSLFARFVRSRTEEPEQGGVGLGLWIVKSIVERHGGRVDAHSSPTGARLCVTLPRETNGEDTSR